MPDSPANLAVSALELVLLPAGLILLWRHALRPAVRAAGGPAPQLAAWDISAPDFLFFVFGTAAGGMLASFGAGLVLNYSSFPADTKTILSGAAFQCGLLIGPALLPLQLGHFPLLPPLTRSTLLSGLATCLIALPVVTAVNLGWLGLLKLTGLPLDSQELLRLVSDIHAPGLLILFVLIATVAAPVTEELLFRAMFFRYLRTRLPRWAALLLPATVFAAFHFNLASFAPLVALAVVFSIAYERTGRIGTVIVAHGLFNLHTVVLVLSGVTP